MNTPTVSGRQWLALAATNGLIAVAAGAFAAHGLRHRLDAESLAIFETAARYQMYHALALGLVAALHLAGAAPMRPMRVAAIAFTLGILIFSGSLYVYSLTHWRPAALITPVGGTAFLVGWLMLAVVALGRSRPR
ncbi:MAG: DUF423 domain-containing protein [Phycisphaerae bacterium]